MKQTLNLRQQLSINLRYCYSSRTVFLKVGGIAPLGRFWMARGQKSKGGDRGRNNIEGAKMLNH